MARHVESEIEFEFSLFDDEPTGGDVADVDLGRGPRPRRLLTGLAAVAVLLGAAFAFGRDAPTEQVEEPPPTTRYVPPPPTGLVAILTDGGSRSWSYGVDDARRVEYHAAWDTEVAAFGGTSILATDGTRWRIGARHRPGQPFVLEQIDADGSVVSLVVPDGDAGLDRTGDVRVIGLTADDRPIVGDLDRQTFVVDADGSVSRFATGLIETVVDHGWYAENRCGRPAGCDVDVHGTGVTSVGSLGLLLVTSFSPDGQRVALVEYTDRGTMIVRVLDLMSGGVVRLEHRSMPISGPWLPGWNRDGTMFSYVADDRFVVIDADRGEADVRPGPSEGFGRLQVAGVLVG